MALEFDLWSFSEGMCVAIGNSCAPEATTPCMEGGEDGSPVKKLGI